MIFKKYILPALIGALATIIGAFITIKGINCGTNEKNIKNEGDYNIEKKSKYDSIKDSTILKSYPAGNLEIFSLEDLKDSDTIKKYIRKKNNLKELSALESGKELNSIPIKSYCFMSPVYFHIESNYENYKTLLQKKVDRFDEYNDYVEIHKIKENVYNAILYFKRGDAINLEYLDGISSKEVIGSSIRLNKEDYIVILPLYRIMYSKYREIILDNKKHVSVFDMIIK